MLKKMDEIQLTPQEKVFYDLLYKYEVALMQSGMNQDKVEEEIAEFLPFAGLFKEK